MDGSQLSLQATGVQSIPDYPDDAEIPPGTEGVNWIIAAASEIKGQGNDSFKQVL